MRWIGPWPMVVAVWAAAPLLEGAARPPLAAPGCGGGATPRPLRRAVANHGAEPEEGPGPAEEERRADGPGTRLCGCAPTGAAGGAGAATAGMVFRALAAGGGAWCESTRSAAGQPVRGEAVPAEVVPWWYAVCATRTGVAGVRLALGGWSGCGGERCLVRVDFLSRHGRTWIRVEDESEADFRLAVFEVVAGRAVPYFAGVPYLDPPCDPTFRLLDRWRGPVAGVPPGTLREWNRLPPGVREFICWGPPNGER